MNVSQTSSKQLLHSSDVGFVAAEDVIDVSPPNYDHNNIAVEADEIFDYPRGWNTRSKGGLIRRLLTTKTSSSGIPSFAIIRKALASVR
jgi:hypothetical protein